MGPYTRLGPYTANTTLTEDNVVVEVDTSGGVVTVTLDASIATDGAWVVVNDVGGSAGTNAVTINTSGSGTINGATSISISNNYGAVTLYSDGTQWYDLGSTGGTL